jgi:hypothetical protein
MTTLNLQNWNFSASVPQERRKVLSNPPSFEAIADAIQREMKILCGHRQACDDQEGFCRFVYCVKVSRSLFDLFFNSHQGYRSQYFRSTATGCEKNRFLVELLSPICLASSATLPAMRSVAERSLSSGSSKVWLAETAAHLCCECEGEWYPPQDETAEILNGRWEIGATSSRYGRKAPYLTKLRIFGGFVDDYGEDYVADRKIERANDIHKTGWA